MYVGPGAAIRGDWGGIVIEDGCNVQENCTIHMFPGVTVVLEASAHIGHGAIVHGARIGRNALIGMNAVVMDNAIVGAGSIVGALCFVPAEMEIPPRKVVVGNPAQVVKEVSDEMLAWKTEGTRSIRRFRRGCTSRCGRASRCARCRRTAPAADRATAPGQEARTVTRDCRATRYGEWVDGERQRARRSIHAVTGEQIAEASSEGLDFDGDAGLRARRRTGAAAA